MKKIFTCILLFVLYQAFNPALAQIPALSSNPSSNFVLMVDMDGHTDNSGWWGGGQVVAAAPGYSSAEATEVFNRIAEDFRPFDINVTTSQTVYNAAPVSNRQRVVITPTDGWYNTGSNNAGGVAYLNTFGGGEIACWVFSNKMGGSVANAAEAASHELGHTLGLHHQSRFDESCNKILEYHSGQGSGQTSWGPLMGTGYGRNISQWYFGPGNGATCTSKSQNDLEIITTNNGFTYRTDDAGNDLGSFISLVYSGPSLSRTGIISTNTDVDFYRITFSSAGIYQFAAMPYAHNASTYSGANLDVKMTIYDNLGNILTTIDPFPVVEAIGTLSLSAGQYFVAIEGSGVPNYLAIGAKGAADYGSLGQYTLTINSPSCASALVSTTSGSRCGTGTVTLSATAQAGSTVVWFNQSGTAVGTGNSYTTPSISATTTYMAAATNGSCTSLGTPVNAIVSVSPTLSAIGGPSTVQVGNTIQLTQTYSFGIWETSNPNVATVSTSGVVTGIGVGTAQISYSATMGSCPTVSVNKTITVFSPTPCPGTPTVTDIEGNVYNTIQIGDQCWTKENLKTGKYADNTNIPTVAINSEWTSLSSGAWCNYNNNSQLNNTYGKLYNWYSVVTNKGLCPAGWHVPDQNEFYSAISYLGGYSLAGGKMKSTTLWNAPNTGATNNSGFSAISGGQRQVGGTYSGMGTEAGFWTVSASEGSSRFVLNHDAEAITSTSGGRNMGQSVRCVKDDETGALPVIQQTYAGANCGPGQVYLYAFADKGFINWYATPTGGSPIGTGNSFQTPLISATTTYYAEAIYGVLISASRAPVTATIKPIFSPGTLTGGDQTFCGSGNPSIISFQAQPVTGDSAAYQWYFQNGLVACPSGNSTTGWTMISGAEGASYDPPTITQSRTYALMVTPVYKRSGGGIGSPGGQICGQSTWAGGCRKITINALPNGSISANGPTTFCQGGSVILTASGGNSYAWTPGGATTSSITVTTSGNFSVLVTAANGCSTVVSQLVTVNPLPSPNAGPDQTLNINQGNITLTGTPSGGIWAGTGVSESGIFTTNLPVGTYPLTYCITNAQSCTKCDTVVITLKNTIPAQVEKPVISPPTGTYSGQQIISITCSTPGALIYYSPTGNIPVVGATHTKLYTGPFPLLQSGTIRAIGVLDGAANSSVAVSYITISNPSIVANPVISPNGGTHDGSVQVSLSTSTSGATIYYTTNGNVPLLNPFPNSFTKIYTGPFTLTNSSTVRAIGVKDGLLNSSVVVANFVVNALAVVAPVVFTPPPGPYASGIMVGMATATTGASIYYTTNGNVPRFDVPNSFTKLYSGPIAINSTTTIRAVATKTGLQNSPSSVGIYTISPGRQAVENAQEVNYYFEELEGKAPQIMPLTLFPNPVSDRLTLHLEGIESDQGVEIQLFDAKGSRVYSQTHYLVNNEAEILVQGYPSGIYQVVVQWEGKVFQTRLVKQ